MPSRAAAVGGWHRLLGSLIGGTRLLGALIASSLVLGASCAAPAPAGPTGGPPAGAAPAGAAASRPAAGPSSGALASPTAPETIKVAASASVSATGFFIGLERGYFREQGIDVEIVPFEGAK